MFNGNFWTINIPTIWLYIYINYQFLLLLLMLIYSLTYDIHLPPTKPIPPLGSRHHLHEVVAARLGRGLIVARPRGWKSKAAFGGKEARDLWSKGPMIILLLFGIDDLGLWLWNGWFGQSFGIDDFEIFWDLFDVAETLLPKFMCHSEPLTSWNHIDSPSMFIC